MKLLRIGLVQRELGATSRSVLARTKVEHQEDKSPKRKRRRVMLPQISSPKLKMLNLGISSISLPLSIGLDPVEMVTSDRDTISAEIITFLTWCRFIFMTAIQCGFNFFELK